MFWWVVTPILAFYLKMSTGVPIDRISHHYAVWLTFRNGPVECPMHPLGPVINA